MIQANELRIGNWVDHYFSDDSDETVTDRMYEQIEASDLDDSDYLKDCQPIPITIDMLLKKMGFAHQGNRISLLIFEGYVSIVHLFNRFPLCLEVDNSRMPLHDIKYVHQLQNLYSALTGEELIIDFNADQGEGGAVSDTTEGD